MAQQEMVAGVRSAEKPSSVYEQHAANAARLVTVRERERSEATTPEAIAIADKRLARARARAKTATADAKRHAEPGSGERPMTLSEARLFTAWLTAQRRKSLTGEPAVARVISRPSLAEGSTESIDYLEFTGGRTAHRLTLTCTSRERALAHWAGYTVAQVETPAEHNRFKGSY